MPFRHDRGLLRGIGRPKPEHSDGDLSRLTLDSLDVQVAALDGSGAIVATNRAWQRAAPTGCRLGTDFVAWCSAQAARGDDAQFRAIAAMLRGMLAGDQESFTSEYLVREPPDRWFALRATTFAGAGPARVVLHHDDITARVRAEQQVREHLAREHDAHGHLRAVNEQLAEVDRRRGEVELLPVERAIRDALEDGRFVLHAQPITDLRTGDTVSHELLIRMLRRDGTVVLPAMFLPTAERCGAIRDIDRWVIREAAALVGRGHPVEVNVSAVSLGDPLLYDDVFSALLDAGAPPSDLTLELTETALMQEEAMAVTFIERIAALGCKFALDDFGTGFGGFGYLKRLPVDFLKIDVEFVRDLATNPASRHVVEAVVSLARAFGYKTVAEGVEDDETLALVTALGVDFGQGYGIGRPAPLEETILRTG